MQTRVLFSYHHDSEASTFLGVRGLEMLVKAGVAAIELDQLFRRAEKDFGDRKR
jgi:hypothetical protein